MTFQVKAGSSKVAPDLFADESSIDDQDSPEDTESEDRREREYEAKELRYIERQKRLKQFKRRRTFINCLRGFLCFQDDEGVFDKEKKIPTCKQVCCWRLLRARRLSHRFHASDVSLHSFEKSRYQSFISILISANYIILYLVLLYPFVLIAQEKLAGGDEAAEEVCIYGMNDDGTCMEEGSTMPEMEEEPDTEKV